MSSPATAPSAAARAALAGAAVTVLLAWGGAGPAGAQPRQGVPQFEMAGQEGAFRRVAEAFITAAAAGGRPTLSGMLSPAIVAPSGAGGGGRFLAREGVPVFAPLQALARR